MNSSLRKAIIFGLLGVSFLVAYFMKSFSALPQVLDGSDMDTLRPKLASEKRLVIFGHSYIAYLYESQFKEYKAKLFGLPGAQAKTVTHKFIFKDMLEYHPDFCFLQIGENDITDDSGDARDVVDSIINLVKILKEHGIFVIIGQLMPRAKPWNQTPQDYENVRIAVNNLLKQKYPNDMIANYNQFTFSHLKEDGIHLNDKGTEMFINIVKRQFDKYLLSS